VQFKKHVLVLYWAPEDANSVAMKDKFRRVGLKFPSVRVKIVNAVKDPTKPTAHHVTKFPTVLLLRDGREIDRLSDDRGISLLESLFRKAQT